MSKKYIALKGNAADDSFFSKLLSSQKAALDSVKTNSNFNGGENVVIYEVTLKAVKKGKIEVVFK